MPSPEPSPRPWRVADCPQCPGLSDVFDASGSPSGLVAGELKPADAALIVDAVNERDRLRDLVKRMADKLEAHRGIFTGAGVYSQTAQEETSKLLREARAAPGVMWGDTAIREDAP